MGESHGQAMRAADGLRPTGHVVLLGDSIFDNKAYVGEDPDVIMQLREELPPGWKASLLAIDGDVMAGVHRQFCCRLPGNGTGSCLHWPALCGMHHLRHAFDGPRVPHNPNCPCDF
jgi:hypothetical protein